MRNHIIKKAGLALVTGLLASASYGQTPQAKTFGKFSTAQPCASTEYEALLQKKYPKRAGNQQFEQWLAPKIQEAKSRIQARNGQGANEIITIPVVVHVIHNGDDLGTNENLSIEQIQSQITVLNQDFRRMLDTRGFNDNPVGADIEVEFCLAQRDPDGFASNGVTRHNIGNDFGFSMEEVEADIKPQTQWDPEQYLNIWTLNYMYVGLGELYGYAQFPIQSGLEGLDDVDGMPSLAATDGVAITANCFGSIEIYPEGTYSETNNLGRTTTHEVGHYLGLRHIWGDGGCNVDDYCEDTPVSGQANSGCTPINTCPNSPGMDMIENYMDYTDDSCKNIFTLDQKDRIVTVLANSPRRASLATSLGCTPGNTVENDGSLELFIESACSNAFTPTISLRNTGSNIITSASIAYFDEMPTLHEWTGNLNPGETANIELPQRLASPGEHTFTAQIGAINNVSDTHTQNNTQTANFFIVENFVTEEITITINTDDWGDENLWILIDNDNNFVAATAQPYGDNQTYTETIQVDGNQCYHFVMVDAAGDGFEEGRGYIVRDSNNNIIAQGGQFTGLTEMTNFAVDIELGTNEVATGINNIVLYPNPATNVVNIAMPGSQLPQAYTIYNSLGQVVNTTQVRTQENLSINTSAYSNGIYFIKIEKDGQSSTMKFIKQ